MLTWDAGKAKPWFVEYGADIKYVKKFKKEHDVLVFQLVQTY